MRRLDGDWAESYRLAIGLAMQVLRYFIIPLSNLCFPALRRDTARIRARVFAGVHLYGWQHSDTFPSITALPADSLYPRFEALLSRFLTSSTNPTTPKVAFQLHSPAAAPAASF